MPSNCACGASFSVEHALSCTKGGFPSIRHNEIRDLTATLLTEVCNDVCIEPELQPVTDEELTGSTANSRTGAVSWYGFYYSPGIVTRWPPLAPEPWTLFRIGSQWLRTSEASTGSPLITLIWCLLTPIFGIVCTGIRQRPSGIAWTSVEQYTMYLYATSKRAYRCMW